MEGYSFDPSMLSKFHWDQVTPSQLDQHVLRGITPDVPFDTAADGSLNEYDAPAQYLEGIVAPPATPKFDGLQTPPIYSFSSPDAEFGSFVWCDAPFDSDHEPDCALLLGAPTIPPDPNGEAEKPFGDSPTQPGTEAIPEIGHDEPLAQPSGDNDGVAAELIPTVGTTYSAPSPYQSPYPLAAACHGSSSDLAERRATPEFSADFPLYFTAWLPNASCSITEVKTSSSAVEYSNLDVRV